MKLKRGDVIQVDFGYGTGAEFRYFHYAVVLATEDNQVVVVPLTSSAIRVGKSKMIVDIGCIEKLTTETNSVKKVMLY